MERTILHVGCGPRGSGVLPEFLQREGWREVRLDIDSGVEPDIVASMTDMTPVADESVDALYSSHNLEHLYAHDVVLALAEWLRVLKPGGTVVIRVPDVQEVATVVAQDKLEEILYLSPAGPIYPVDVLWGLRSALAAGNHFMAHKTGFTQRTLDEKLRRAGFGDVSIARGNYELTAAGVKPGADPILTIRFEQHEAMPPQSRWQYVLSLLTKGQDRA